MHSRLPLLRQRRDGSGQPHHRQRAVLEAGLEMAAPADDLVADATGFQRLPQRGQPGQRPLGAWPQIGALHRFTRWQAGWTSASLVQRGVSLKGACISTQE